MDYSEQTCRTADKPHQDVLGDVRGQKNSVRAPRGRLGVKGDATSSTKANFAPGCAGSDTVNLGANSAMEVSVVVDGLNRRPVPLPVVCGTRYTHAKPEKMVVCPSTSLRTEGCPAFEWRSRA